MTTRRPADGAGARPAPPATPPVLLFLCVQNAGRSQMAAAFARALAGERARVLGGGSSPADAVHPAVVRAMAAVGIDLGAAVPARWTDEDLAAADVVVTMGCGDACPFVPGKRYEDWDVADPAGAPDAAVEGIRDDIRARVAHLLGSLGVEAAPPGR